MAKQRDHEHYEKNKEKILARAKAYNQTPGAKARRLACSRKRRAALPWEALLHSAKRRSKGVRAFELTPEWARTRWTGRCELTGLAFSPPGGSLALAATIDRKDPSLGYTPENCRFILYALNAIKGVGTDEEMWQALEVISATRKA